jgi:hypothetical protein
MGAIRALFLCPAERRLEVRNDEAADLQKWDAFFVKIALTLIKTAVPHWVKNLRELPHFLKIGKSNKIFLIQNLTPRRQPFFRPF